ncbi:MAG: 50S ribosomal protein L29 [Spirochaetes bacterium]|nr:50S ribosomal protein L29 [Spirochaetota bacterium]
MTTEQLSAKLTEMQAEYQKRRFTKVTGELTQVHLVKAARRDIARIKTYLRAHALQAAKK